MLIERVAYFDDAVLVYVVRALGSASSRYLLLAGFSR